MFRVDSDGISGAVLVLVDRIHRQQSKPVTDIAVQGHAQVSRCVADHEGDQLRGGLLGRKDEVSLVLPILVIHDDDSLAGRDVGDRALDRVQPRHRSHLVRKVHPKSSGVASSMNHHVGLVIATAH